MSIDETNSMKADRTACRRFDAELPAFMEGAEGTSVRSHAEECSQCYGALADLEEIRALAQDLPLLDPPAHLWSKVRATLATEGVIRESSRWQDRWLSLFGIRTRLVPIAGLASLAAFSLLLVLPPGLNNAPSYNVSRELNAPVAVSSAADLQLTAMVKTLGTMEQDYHRAEIYLDPALKATYEKGLSVLDTSIHEASDSVQAQPDNALARQYLMEAYEAKAQVLASALEANGQ